METILSIKSGSTVYLGDLPRTRPHKHAAVVLLIGLSGPIRIEFEHNVVIECRSALLDAGVNHLLDPCGQRMTAVFFDLSQSFTQSLRFQYFQNTPYAFDIIDLSLVQKTIENRLLARHWDDVFPVQANRAAVHCFDARILECLNSLQMPERFSEQQSDFAARVSLSTSRLNHVFKDVTGVSFRHYKLWSQLLYFMKSLNQSKNLLDAAHNSGFYDSAHLSNSYRKMLGIAPSSIIRNLDRFEV
jgi:AraC-like DNA-binding protein